MRRITRYFLLFLLFALLCAGPATAQPLPGAAPASVGMSAERLARIDEVAKQYVDDGLTVGATVLVARHGRLVHLGTYGMADRETGRLMSADTIFRIASQTKALVTTAAMTLYEEGAFLLNDPVSKYIPAFSDMEVLVMDEPGSSDEGWHTVPAERPITILNLMTHTSGISYGIGNHPILGPRYAEAAISDGLSVTEGTIKDMVLKLARQPLMFQPGERYNYSLGIDVLGYLIEVVSGMPLDEFMESRLFDPLNMTDTHFSLPPQKHSRFAALYERTGGRLNRASDTEKVVRGYSVHDSFYQISPPGTYFSGGAGLASTIGDYARFCQMMLNGGELDGIRILSRKSVELMTTNAIGDLWNGAEKFGIGFGIRVPETATDELGSPGTYRWGGYFGTSYWIDPVEDMIILYMNQTQPGNSDLGTKVKVLAYQAIDD